MKNKNSKRILSGLCLFASLIITFISYRTGFSQALQGNSPSLLIHIGAFIVAAALVLLAIIIQMRSK